MNAAFVALAFPLLMIGGAYGCHLVEDWAARRWPVGRAAHRAGES